MLSILYHDYFKIDYEIVIDIIQNKLPDLKDFIDKVISENNDQNT